MTNLPTIILEILDNSVTSTALRFSVRGLGLEICNSMLELRLTVGTGEGDEIKSHSLYLWAPDSESNDSWPLSPGIKAGRLRSGQLVAARNEQDLRFVTLYPSGGAASDSQVQAETELTDILEKVEESFFNELGYEGTPTWYDKLCNSLLNSPNLNWGVRNLSEVRWHILEAVDHLIRVNLQDGNEALAMVIGFACEPNNSTDCLSMENWQIVEKLSKLLASKSFDAVMQEFEISLANPEVFQNAEIVREALNNFKKWLNSSGSSHISQSRKDELSLYCLDNFRNLTHHDESWRKILDRTVWVRLLSNTKNLEKTEIVVYAQEAPANLLIPINSAGKEIYLIEDYFQLSFLNNNQPHLSGWVFSVRAGNSLSFNQENTLQTFDLANETRLADLFEHPLKITPKIAGVAIDKSAWLLCIAKHRLGIYILCESAKKVEQPNLENGKYVGDIVLKSSGGADVQLCFDPVRFQFSSVLLDGELSTAFVSGSVLKIPIHNAGEEQILSINLISNQGPLAIEIPLVPETIVKGEHYSCLHHLAAMHVKQKSVNNNICSPGWEKRRQLLDIIMECNECRPAAVVVGDEDWSDMTICPQSQYICNINNNSFLQFLITRANIFDLPNNIKESRYKLWQVFVSLSHAQSPEMIDFSNPIILKPALEYLEAFDNWFQTSKIDGISALEVMASVTFYNQHEAKYSPVLYMQLPLHPLRLLGLINLTLLLKEEDVGDKGERLWHPPLSRLLAMTGPRFWKISSPTGDDLYQIGGLTSPYYPVYNYFGKPTDEINQSHAFLSKEFCLHNHSSSLSLSSGDIPQLMNDVCTLNSSLSQLNVYLNSDPIGEVSRGIIDWYKGEGDDENSLGNIYDDWGKVSPLNLNVFSSSAIIDENQIDGLVATSADIPGRRLTWSATNQAATPSCSVSIIAAISTRQDGQNPSPDHKKPSAVSLQKIGCEWRLEYKLDRQVYAESFGSQGLSGSFNGINASSNNFASGLIESWNETVKSSRKNFNYQIGRLGECIQSSQFVALPISTNSGILAAAGLNDDSAVWKYKQSGFGVGEAATGHIILTNKLQLLEGRFGRILRRAGLLLSVVEQRQIMILMGRVGLNALHHLSDNEQSLLGAVSSVAVLRIFPQLVTSVPDAWPTMVLPLDPFEEQFKQLKSIKRPDFLCFDVTKTNGFYNIVITVLEAKWRKTSLSDRDLANMLNDQCNVFINNVKSRFQLDNDLKQRKIAAAVFLSELLVCAIKLFSANTKQEGFSSDQSALKCSDLIEAVFNDRCKIEWGPSVLAVISPGHESFSILDYKEPKSERWGKLVRISVKDCLQYLQNLTDTPEIFTKSDPIQAEISQLPKTLEVFPEISMAPDNSKEITAGTLDTEQTSPVPNDIITNSQPNPPNTHIVNDQPQTSTDRKIWIKIGERFV